MDAVLRATAIYLFLMLVFRLAGKRTLAQVTTFDLVLLLIISEATQQGLLGNDFSVTNAFLVIGTLVALDMVFDWAQFRWPRFARATESLPLVVVEDGRPLHDRLDRMRLDEEDVLEAARSTQGLERMDQIRLAVVERSGGISVVPN